jgi:hypothetical protein
MMLQISLNADDTPRNQNRRELAVADEIARMKQSTKPHTTSTASRRQDLVQMLLCSFERSCTEA